MRYLSHPIIRTRLRTSFPILVACLALPAALAQATGLELASRSADDGSAGMSTKPISPVTVENALGAPGDPIPLTVTVSAKPGQSVLNTYLVGLPKGAGLTDTKHAVTATDEKAAIDVTDWNLPRLSVVLPPAQAGTYTLAVVAVSRPNDDGPSNFTSSTFTLKAILEGREAGLTNGTSALETKRPDTAVVGEALRQPWAAPPSAATSGNMAVQVGSTTSKTTTPITEAVAPKALANLWREEEFSTATAQSAVAPPSPGDRRSHELRPAATPAASSALAALATTVPTAIAPPVAVIPPVLTPATVAPATDADGKALVERAERLIRVGDISGARLVLERASDRGDPRATFLLAQTCDPRMLREWKVQGLKPDPDRARALYAKAAQGGHHETSPITYARR